MSPVIVTAPATRKMPRGILLALCALYILPGLLGRDPWDPSDAVSFGLSLTLSRADLYEWLAPHVFGQMVSEHGPLLAWMGAIAMKGLGWLVPADTALRLMHVGLLWYAFWCVWEATYLLATRAEAQPDDLFGAAPSRIDFGRAVADTALLITLATIGLVFRLHLVTPESASITIVASAYLLLAWSLIRPRVAGSLLGLLSLLALLLRGLPLLLPLLLSGALLALLNRQFRFVAGKLWLGWIGAFSPGLLLWVGLQQLTPEGVRYLQAWWTGQMQWVPTLSSLTHNGVWLIRNSLWFLWPSWPMAWYALRAEDSRPNGRHLHERISGRLFDAPHLAVPLTLALCLILPPLCSASHPEPALLAAALPVAGLAAFGLPRLRRSLINLIDWFAVMVFSLLGIFIWLGWIAAITGWPERLARRADVLVPGFEPQFITFEFIAGLVMTVLWLWIVRWRISRQPRVVWRAVVLSCGGLVLAWSLLMTLWLPAFNYAKTYRDVGHQLAQLTPPDAGCVATQGVGLAQRATLAYYANLNFEVPSGGSLASCNLLLVQDRRDRRADARLPAGEWLLIWEGRRNADRKEKQRFRLYQRASSN